MIVLMRYADKEEKKKKKKTMMIISIVLFMKVCFSRKDRSISKIMRRKKIEAIAEKH
jgi:hypothetical protein